MLIVEEEGSMLSLSDPRSRKIEYGLKGVWNGLW